MEFIAIDLEGGDAVLGTTVAEDFWTGSTRTAGYPYSRMGSDSQAIGRWCMEKELLANGGRGALLHLVAAETS